MQIIFLVMSILCCVVYLDIAFSDPLKPFYAVVFLIGGGIFFLCFVFSEEIERFLFKRR